MNLFKQCAILLLVVTMCLVPVGFETVYAQETDSVAFEMLKSLGVAAQKQSGDITRIQFAELTAYALKFVPPSSREIYNPFEDVSGSGTAEAAVAFLKDMGVVHGSGGKYYPNDVITYTEASYLILKALGYSNYILSTGNSESDILTLARRTGIYTNTSFYGNKVSFDDAYSMLYKMLTADLMDMVGVSSSNVSFSSDSGETILSRYWNAYALEDVVTANESCHLFDKNMFLNHNSVMIGTETYKDENLIVRKHLGYNVVAFADEYNNILAAAAKDNKALEVDLEEFAGYNDFKFSYNQGNNTRSASISSGFAFIRNGRPEDLKNEYFEAEGTVKFVDYDMDNKYDVIFVENPTYVVVSSVDLNNHKIYDVKSSANAINMLEEDNKLTECYVSDKGNVSECVYTDYQAGDVVRAVVSNDGLYVKTVACRDVVNGVLEMIDSENGYTVSGVVYKTNKYFDANYSIAIGEQYTFALASDGTITSVSSFNYGIKYGYFVNINTGKSVLDDTVKIKLLASSGDVMVHEVAEKFVLDGITVNTTKNTSWTSNFINGEMPQRQLVRYQINSDNKIDMLDTVISNRTVEVFEDSELKQDSLYKNVERKTIQYKSSGNFENRFVVDNTVTIFVVPSGIDTVNEAVSYSDDEFRCITSNQLSNDTRKQIEAYDIGVDGKPGAIVMYSDADSAVDVGSMVCVVDKVIDYYDETKGATKRLHYWYNNKFYEASVNDRTLEKVKAASSGDVVRLELENNEVVAFNIDYSPKNPTMLDENAPSAAQLNFLKIKPYIASQMALICPENNGTYDIYNFKNTYFALYDSERKTIQTATWQDIVDIKSAGDSNATELVVTTSYWQIRNCIIYK